MDQHLTDLLRAYGASSRAWAAAGRHHVQEESWLSFSGDSNVDFNLTCCWSASAEVLTQRCLQPVLDLGQPAIIMLVGPGLSTAQTLIDAGWVSVGAKPLMRLTSRPMSGPQVAGVRALALEELPLAREVLMDAYGLDQSRAATALPNSVVGRDDIGVWGLSAEGRLVASVTVVDQDGLAVVWSMATRRESQGHGYGRRLLETVLGEQFEKGATGSLLLSSRAGERLYRSLGYSEVEYLQLWSRPRWVLGFA